MIRVAFLTPSLRLSGPEMVLSMLARNFHACEPIGCIFAGKEQDAPMAQRMRRAVPIHQVRGTEYDVYRVVHEVCRDADVLIAWGFLHLKTVTEGLGIPVVDISHVEPEFRDAAAIVEQSCRGATHHVAVSERAALSFPADIRGQVAVIPNGIELDRLCPTDKEATLESWGLDPKNHDKVALYVGRLHPLKNVGLLVDAARFLPPDWIVVIQGDGPEKAKLMSQAGRNVVFCEPSWCVGNSLVNATVLAQPSKTEADSLIELEARVFQLPVVRLQHPEQRTAEQFAKSIVEEEQPITFAWHWGRSVGAMVNRWERFVRRICLERFDKHLMGIPAVHARRRKKRVLALYDVRGWAYWHRTQALAKYAPHDWEVIPVQGMPNHQQLAEADVILCPMWGGHVTRRSGPVMSASSKSHWAHLLDTITNNGLKTKIVGILSIDAQARPDDIVKQEVCCDAMVYTNAAHYDKAREELSDPDWPPLFLIPNGVDLDVFRPTCRLSERPRNVLWCGSKFHAKQKGYDILTNIAGSIRDRGWTIERMLVDSHQASLTPAQMASWYNCGRIYVVLSEHEGTPNPALEAAACGCVLISTRVGNMPDLIKEGVNGFLIERSEGALLRVLDEVDSRNLKFMSAAGLSEIQKWSWKDRAADYFTLFDGLLSGDLSKARQINPATDSRSNSAPESAQAVASQSSDG